MEEVVGRLSGQLQQSRLFLFGGGKEEKMLLDEWAGKYAKCTNASSLLGGLQQELVLMSQLDCMVSMDSANMHLASLVAVPVVSVWGATHPYAGFMGWQQKEENAVQVDLPCRPCSIYGERECRFHDYRCLTRIKPEAIVKRVIDAVNPR
jgi:ADP-heptose:LPS heptosyltransferase